jgi:hypothetical protein
MVREAISLLLIDLETSFCVEFHLEYSNEL